MHRLDEFGFSADNFKFDIDKIVARSRAVSQQLSNGVGFLMKKHKITVIAGEAKLAGKGKLSVTKDGKATEYTAKNIVLATGARARTLPGLEPDGKLIWTYREAMVPPSFPKSLLVVGSRRHRHRVRQLLSHPGRRGDRGRSAGPRAAGGRRGNLRLRRQGFHQAGHEAQGRHHRHRAEERRGQCHRHLEGQGRQDRNPHRGPRDPGHGHCRQCREYRPGSRRHQSRPHPCRRRQIWRDRRRRRLGDRRSGRRALAGAQGDA